MTILGIDATATRYTGFPLFGNDSRVGQICHIITIYIVGGMVNRKSQILIILKKTLKLLSFLFAFYNVKVYFNNIEVCRFRNSDSKERNLNQVFDMGVHYGQRGSAVDSRP